MIQADYGPGFYYPPYGPAGPIVAASNLASVIAFFIVFIFIVAFIIFGTKETVPPESKPAAAPVARYIS